MGYNAASRPETSILTNTPHGLQTGRSRSLPWCILAAALALAAAAAPDGVSAAPVPLTFVGTLPRGDDLSAIESFGRFLVLASDEDSELRVLEPTDVPNTYLVRPDAIRLERKGEVDIEAMARAGEWLYVLGSHSLKRPLVDPSKSREQNRERLTEVSDEPLRQRLYRLRLSESTGALVGAPQWISLRPMLERDPIVGPFTRIPAGENGVNLEGLAAAEDGGLYLGFRSPVLREGFVPVMRTTWREPSPASAGLLLLDLGGRGIRSLERVRGGFLVLATAERESGPSEAIYFWDGRDQIPGTPSERGSVERLLELEPPPGGATEGLCVTVDTPDRLEVIVLHDGVAGGYPLRLTLPRAHSAR